MAEMAVDEERNEVASNAEDTGLEVIDLLSDPEFMARRLHDRNVGMQMEGMKRLANAFVESPDTILQELVNAAIDLCGAESAGISVEREDRTDEVYWHWVATSGVYEGFLDAMLPKQPSACGLCLERGRPQIFRVNQKFFDLMGISAALVTDGILLPWQTEETRGTIWIMAHGRTEAFDSEDVRMMQVLADFAAMGVREQRQRERLMEREKAAAAAAKANELAHGINNPLQSLTNLVFLASQTGEGKVLAGELAEHLARLNVLVGKLLELPAK